MRIYLVSPYHSGSHAAWANGLAASSAHAIELITMTGRFWKWRMHGGAVTLAEQSSRRAQTVGPADVVLATDMVDVPTYLGLLSRHELRPPLVLYFHENQFSYPISPRSQDDLTFGMMNWKSMLAADRVVFNSEFHRAEVFGLLPGFLKNFPDHRHLDLIPAVEAKASVLPVGIDVDRFPPGRRSDPPLVLWAQRWEHDKNPDEMIAAVDRLLASGRRVRIAVAGENFRNEPAEFVSARERWGDRVVHFGWADDDRYAELVAAADIVVSTAFHEFFGIAIVEALAAGAWPVLPNRLSYPELLDPTHATEHLYDDFEGLVAALCRAVDEIEMCRRAAGERRSYYFRYDWARVAPAYDELLATVAAG